MPEEKRHVITTKGTRQQMRADCTCGWTSRIGRLKVVAGRLTKHSNKTGHQWEASS